jgi:hypothetical protein
MFRKLGLNFVLGSIISPKIGSDHHLSKFDMPVVFNFKLISYFLVFILLGFYGETIGVIL